MPAYGTTQLQFPPEHTAISKLVEMGSHTPFLTLTLPTVMAVLVRFCAVWGELRLGSCSPAAGRRRCKLQKREIAVSHCPRGRQSNALVSQQKTLPALDLHQAPQGLCPCITCLCCYVHPAQPQLPKPHKVKENAGDAVGWAQRTAARSPTAHTN